MKMKMSTAKHIEMALAYIGKSEAWLARQIGTTPQNFNNRKKVGKFSDQEMEAIASALGAEYEMNFTFPDGTKL